jgi:hypothetical protein
MIFYFVEKQGFTIRAEGRDPKVRENWNFLPNPDLSYVIHHLGQEHISSR